MLRNYNKLSNICKISFINIHVKRLLSSKIMFQNGFRAALIQCRVGKDRIKNLENASKLIETAKANGAQVVALPECFNSPYGTKFFDEYAESIPDGPTSKMLSNAAKNHSLFLIGGTFPERDNNKLYNTCTVWNPSGEMIAKFRKLHLFDIDIPGGITFKESDILCGGNDLVTFEMNGVTVGLGICYDMRFEELAKLYCLKGCKLLVYPGAFNMTTGPLHWELLQRARALDNQLYVFAISPARGDKGYIAWGHSQITDPWGKVIAQAGHDEEIIYADVNLTECEKVRRQIPILSQRRTDIFDTIWDIKPVSLSKTKTSGRQTADVMITLKLHGCQNSLIKKNEIIYAMPISRSDIIQVCEILARDEGIRVATNESLKGACCAFAGAFVGGILGGPFGIAVGGAAGGTFAALKSQGKFKSAVYVITNEMSPEEQNRLINAVNNIIRKIDASDVITLITILNANNMMKTAVIEVIKNCLTQEMGLTLV